MKRQKRRTKRQRQADAVDDAIAREMELALTPPKKLDTLIDRVYRYTGRLSSNESNLSDPRRINPQQTGIPGLLAVDYETLEQRVLDYAKDDAKYTAHLFGSLRKVHDD